MNEEFEYKLGTYAPYVGAVPDTLNPPHVKPVWGTAEVLGLVVSTVDSTGTNLRQPYSYKVKPEPGKPDHFSVSVPPPASGTPEPVWTYWSDNGKGAGVTVNGRTGNGVDLTLSNRYYLMDQYENVTFGYTALQQPVAPGQTISLSLFDQTSGATPTGGAAEPNGYGWRITWNDNPAMPSGPYNSTLTVNYPTDPDWTSGSVSKGLSFQFDRGTFQFLIAIDGWDYLVNPPVAYDPRPPYTVSPGATGDALPKSVNQPDPLYPQTPIDAARFALVLGRGTFTPVAPYTVFVGSDPVVEVVDNPAFRVSLVDGKNAVATDARFQVHPCPRVDHFPPDGHTLRPCTTPPVQSTAGVIPSIRVNASGPGAVDSQGYMGLELLQAPANPGTYYIKFETLESKQYRIREMGDISWDRTPAGEYQGAFSFVTVVGGEILDGNFRPVDPLVIEQPTQAYVRLVDPSETAATVTISLTTFDSKNQPVSSNVPVNLVRVGASSTFIGPITFAPKGWTAPERVRREAALSGPTALGDFVRDFIQGIKGGKNFVQGNLSVPAQLRVQWLKEDGQPGPTQQVTRIVKIPDSRPGQVTRYLYAEETLLRVIATDSQGVIAPNADGVIRVDEAPNTAFPSSSPFTSTPDWRFSYQNEPEELGVATDLRPARSGPGAFTAVSLTAGKTDVIRLRSLAGPRKVNLGQLYSQTWDAQLDLCEAHTSTSCSAFVGPWHRFKPGTGAINQWVDQQAYGRHAPFGSFTLGSCPNPDPANCNGVRDWIEAMAWDALSDAPPRGSVIADAANCVSGMREAPGTGSTPRYAETGSDRITKWFPQMFDEDAMRWDSDRCSYADGFEIDEKTMLTAIALHEARHCWQWKIVLDNRASQDQDLDFIPTSPEAFDPLSLRLKDDHYTSVVGGNLGNLEAHFAGPTTPDVQGGNVIDLWGVQRERDSEFFEQTATVGIPQHTVVSPSLIGGVLKSPASGSLSLAVGANGSGAIKVTVTGDIGVCDDDANTSLRHQVGGTGTAPGIAGVVVELTVSPSSGLNFTPVNTSSGYTSGTVTVAESDGSGVAQFDLVATTAGSYTVTLSIRQLVSDGRTQGAVIKTLTVPVTVTP